MASLSFISIDRTSPIPLYHQLVSEIKTAISTGALTAGTMLPNELDIAAQLHLSRPTVRKAMDELVRAGLLVRKRGVGTQVVSNEIRRPLTLSSLYTDLTLSGVVPSTEVLEFNVAPAPHDIVAQLNLTENTDVYHILRLRLENNQPLAIMENWIPAHLGTIDKADLEKQGLYDTLRAMGVTFSLAHQTVGATIANEFQATTLNTTVGAPLVHMKRTALDDIGTRVETGRHVYRADLYSFEMTLSN
ncbi:MULTISPECIES: GntR family transcriptional regulator [Rothia]|uniref:GntR family transcriptional regulator n=1 Tax=Rothia nasimurium TaxID=85336 RepID=A0A1Y1RN36_9MICC|nr:MULTISPECIES: GntR family transcriptional regulator [Rothia]ORC15998.1 GntR family transcriptional regulator [Rothia nasimurium]